MKTMNELIDIIAASDLIMYAVEYIDLIDENVPNMLGK